MNKHYISKKNFIWFILVILVVSLFAAAKDDRSFQDAEIYYQNGNYSQAMNSMNRTDPNNRSDADYLLLLAKIQIELGEYEEALATLEDYRAKGGQDYLLEMEIYPTIEDAYLLSVNDIILHLPGRLNSIHSEYAPIVNEDGDFMVFGSDRRSPYKGENIFYSAFLNGAWTEPMEVKELSTDRNEAPGSFDKAGNLYLSGQYDNKRKEMNSSIYLAELDGKKWKKPVKIEALSSDYNDINPFIYEDQVMVFASNRLGDHKSYDIFVSEYSYGTWTTPIPIGAAINTNGNEISPFIAEGGHLLFFASDTHKGFGGFDIFFAKRNGDSWTDWATPQNIGPIINSQNDERNFFLPKGSLIGYFSTARYDMINMENIVGIDMEAFGYKLVHGYVHDETDARVETIVNWRNHGAHHHFSTQTNENGEFSFLLSPTESLTYNVNDERYFEVEEDVTELQKETEIIIPLQRKNVLRLAGRAYDQYDDPVITNIAWTYEHEGETVKRTSPTNDDGYYLMEVPQIRYIDFSINEPGYVPLSGRWNLIEGEAYQTRDFILTAYAKGQEYGFIIEFDYDKADIRPDTMPEVARMYQMLDENPTMRVEIAGHTDNRGPGPYNMGLSQRRAESVRNELARRGINRNRMTIGAYGLENPIADNDTDEGRQRNRRVEMVILSID